MAKPKKILGDSTDFIIYMDIVDFSKQKSGIQRSWYDILEKAVKKVIVENSLVYNSKSSGSHKKINSYLNSLGDGFVIVLSCEKFKDNLQPFKMVLSIIDDTKESGLSIRFGLHKGLNDWRNSGYEVTDYPLVIGTGINDCSRIIGYGHKNHIMMSHEFGKGIKDQIVNKLNYEYMDLGLRKIKHGKKIHLCYAFKKDDKTELFGCSDTPIKGTIKEESIKDILIANLVSFSQILNAKLESLKIPAYKRKFKLSVLVKELTPNGEVLVALNERVDENGSINSKKSKIEFTKNTGIPSIVFHKERKQMELSLPNPQSRGDINKKYANMLKDVCNLEEIKIKSFSDYDKKDKYKHLPRTFISILLYYKNKKFGVLSIDSPFVWKEAKSGAIGEFLSQEADYIKNIGAALEVQ